MATKLGKISAAAAVPMIGLAVSLSTAGWPEIVRAHPNAVIAVWVAATLLSLIAISQLDALRRFFPSSAPRPEDPQPRISVQVNPVFNNSPSIAQIASPIQINSRVNDDRNRSETEVRKKVPLQIEKPEFLFIQRTHTDWRIALAGTVGATLGAIAWIHNAAGDEGQISEAIESSIASLTFHGDNRILGSVPTAYWLEEFGHEVDIKVGQRRGILLGLLPGGLEGPLWIAAENLRRAPMRSPQAGSVLYVPGPKWSELVFAQMREVDVSIVTDGVTIRKFTVLIESKGPGKRNLALK